MQIRTDRILLPSVGLLMLLGACSSGENSGSGLGGVRCTSLSSTKFCLVSCNLGCSSTGCGVTQIAQNQPISLTFSQPVDPASVNSATVLLRTVSGEPPIGDLLVNGSTVSFQPKIEIQGGTTFFGFRANETYVLTLPAGGAGGDSLRAASGEGLGAQVVCSLLVNRGVVDLDNQAPVPTLISPTATTNVSRGTSIVVQFSELIDAAPFAGSGDGSPVEFFVSKAIRSGGQPVCDSSATPIPLPGVPRVQLDPITNKTTLSFRPSVTLPSEACIEVRVTNRVRDLSGRSAEPVTYRFITESVSTEILDVTEEFENDGRLDRSGSSTTWTGGTALPGVLGGSGKHGVFDPAIVDEVGGVFTWDLDRPGGFVIPARLTLTGRDEAVVDGSFEFMSFRMPAGKRLRFIGSRAPVIRVRGEVVIEGTIDVAALDMAQYSSAIPGVGQAGGVGGPGGARGGKGGDTHGGTGAPNNGENGLDVRVAASHAYAGSAVGTGGRGALQFPLNNTAVTHTLSNLCMQLPSGGGGGGYQTAGSPGRSLLVPSNLAPDLGPDTEGGTAFTLFPVPSGASSLEHFLVGGSGGGGGTSHSFYHSVGRPFVWKSGCGGSGGGGAVVFRAGGALTITTSGKIWARGGNAFDRYENLIQGPPGPSGGGSGGSVVLQSATSVSAQGEIDIRGGAGVVILPGPNQLLNFRTTGGNGAPGFVRAEMPNNPGIGILANVLPGATANMVGDLSDTDPRSGFLTRWYSTRQLFAPRYLRYEVEADVGGVPVVYSDDPTKGVWARVGAGTPVEILFQAGAVNPRDGTLTGAPGPWRSTVGTHQGQSGLNADGLGGFRFTVFFNQRTNVAIRKVTVFFES